MNAADLHDHATRQAAEARRTIEEHRTEAYTRVCRSCGRPGPCEEQRAARSRLLHHDRTLHTLRDAWLATIAAADRAGGHLDGVGPPGRRLPWQDAVTECWRALGLVYAGLSEARLAPESAGDLLDGLRAARADADRAAALAATVRWRLAATEDRLRHPYGDGGQQGPAAARRFAAAIARLDLVAARLAVGAASTGGPARSPARPNPPPAPAGTCRSTRWPGRRGPPAGWSPPGAARPVGD
ncbi:hypothetical protein ABZ671_21295 [Micromonospora sp. NPDC006766]|uniref:hypothetical protein n=1 Tax=Micromonospora sp. NPDC006766 TaxID=3154778 RepID=UPI0033DF8698